MIHFLIPIQISKAKLLVHLADNGMVGCLTSDSKIDTLVSANKQGFGLFDDLLRKAYHHEPIGSSKKGDNEFIRIDHPYISLVLGDTPSQFTWLIPSAENGPMSHLLLYTCRTAPVWQDVSPRAVPSASHASPRQWNNYSTCSLKQSSVRSCPLRPPL